MANLEQRSGGVVIRLGGNTQEFAAMVPSLPNGSTFSKTGSGSTQTVWYTFTSEKKNWTKSILTIFFFFRPKHRRFYIRWICFTWLLIFLIWSMLNGSWVRAVSSTLSIFKKNCHSYSGIPFNDSVNWRLTIAEEGQQILGSNLLGLQAGNEPDFYETYVKFISILFFFF